MVFMGSEKYPRENDFDDYVSHHDGKLNANTWGDYTVFFFDIQRSSFKEALDKFANFFIAPLLKKDCVDRELEAVHSGGFCYLFSNLHSYYVYWFLSTLQNLKNVKHVIFGVYLKLSLRLPKMILLCDHLSSVCF